MTGNPPSFSLVNVTRVIDKREPIRATGTKSCVGAINSEHWPFCKLSMFLCAANYWCRCQICGMLTVLMYPIKWYYDSEVDATGISCSLDARGRLQYMIFVGNSPHTQISRKLVCPHLRCQWFNCFEISHRARHRWRRASCKIPKQRGNLSWCYGRTSIRTIRINANYASVTKPSLVQIMVCRLVGTKPLSGPMIEYC